MWIRAFLKDRPQTVCIEGHSSIELVLNTGAPQGCVLLPILFSIYTNEIMCNSSNSSNLTLVKFADDMALVACLKDEKSLKEYFDYIDFLISWFGDSFLKLNVQKTKELYFEEHRVKDTKLLKPVVINNIDVDKVQHFKYLGTVLDSHCNYKYHADYICKKANQRLFLLRKLRSFDINKKVLGTVYCSLIESILTFNIITWFGHLTLKDRNRLNRIVKIASKVIGLKQNTLSDLYTKCMVKKSKYIIKDKKHPLHKCFELLPSGKRFKVPSWNRKIYRSSFMPSAINILNLSKITL